MENELQHHGIKGMKWGVRRYQNKNGSLTNSGKKRYNKAVNKFTSSKVGSKYKLHDDPKKELREVEGRTPSSKKKRNKTKGWSKDAKNANRIKSKSVKQMTNKELKQLNERTRLEQEYSRLNPSTIKKGANFAKAAVAATGTALTIYNNSDKIVNAGKRFVTWVNKR